MKYTIVDANGSIKNLVELSDETMLAVQMADGDAAVNGWPDSYEFRRIDGAWVPLSPRPTRYHNWDRAALQWADPRTLLMAQNQRNRDLLEERNARLFVSIPPDITDPVAYQTQVLSTFAQLKAQVDAATTNQEVDAVLWP